MHGFGHGVPAEMIRQALQHILQSSDFEASERNRRFLQYVVEETLAGRAERIKAYSVATDVFGREQGFDPQADPIVRIEAGRLRRALERYYLTAGSDDPVRIGIPKGSYVPAFQAAEGPDHGSQAAGDAEPEPAPEACPSAAKSAVPEFLSRRPRAPVAVAAILAVVAAVLGITSIGVFSAVEPAPETAAVRRGPAVFVAAFGQEGGSATFPDFGKGFTREVIVGLTRFNDLFVFGPETTFRHGDAVDARQVAADLGVEFVLTGGTTLSADRFGVHALLIDATTGQNLWAERFTGSLGTASILAARDEIANRVARSLAQPYGVIFANQVEDTAGAPPGALTSYECVMRFYLYWRTYRRTEFPGVQACLERAIAADPSYTEAFAALSLVHSDAYRFGFGERALAGDPREMALRLARRAIELAPHSSRGHHALSLALWLTNDVEGSLEAARKGLSLNPNDTELMAELGMRFAWRNRWEEGLSLLRDAYARNPGQPSGYRLAFFLDHYLHGRYEPALAEARRIDAPQIVYGHLAVAMSAGALGRAGEAQAAVGRLLAIDPAYGEHVVQDLEKRNIHPDLVPVIVEGLRKAGLNVPEAVGREKI
jgi:adenylate cyclase